MGNCGVFHPAERVTYCPMSTWQNGTLQEGVVAGKTIVNAIDLRLA
jgi:hypothetical protein